MENLQQERLARSLFLVRVSISVVLFISSVDKIFYPEHAQELFFKLYHFESISPLSLFILGVAELFVVVLFAAGLLKTFSYGAVFGIQLFSTLTIFDSLETPFFGDRIVFFDNWPLLATTWLLFTLRDQDSLFGFSKKK